MKTYASDYLTHCKGSRTNGMGWAVVLAYDTGSFLRFASTDISTGLYYHGCVSTCDFSVTGFDPYDGTGINGSVKITLSDGDGHVSDLLSGKAIVNRSVTVYRYIKASLSIFGGGAATPISNDPEFVGIVTSYSYDVETCSYILECESGNEHRVIPQTKITQEAYPKAPKSAINSILPIVYGSFAMSSARADEAHGLVNVAPTVCTDETTGTYVVSEHDCYALNGALVSHFIDGIDAYGYNLRAYDGSGYTDPTSSTTGPASITLPVPSNHRFWTARRVYMFPKLKGTYNQVAGDIANAIDGDYNTNLTVGASTRLAIKFQGIGSGGEFRTTAISTEVELFNYVQSRSGAATPGGIYNPLNTTAYSPSSSASTGLITYALGAPTNRTDVDATAIGATTQWTWEEIGRNEFYISVQAGASQSISAIGLYLQDLIISGDRLFPKPITENRNYNKPGMITHSRGGRRRRSPVLSIGYFPDEEVGNLDSPAMSHIFCEVTGRKYGSWIGSRNGLSSSLYHIKSNYIIESILRDELGVSGTYIDETAFDNDYASAYDFAFSLNRQVRTDELIEDLAYQSACYCVRLSSGVWTIYRLPDTPSTSTVDLDYSTGDVRINNIQRTSSEWITNDVTVSYHFDYARESFLLDTNAGDATSKADSSSGTNSTQAVNIAAKFIRKSSDSGATDYAEALRDHRLANWKDTHNIVSFTVLNPTYFSLEELDVVTFDNVSTNWGGIGGGSAGDYWSSFDSIRSKYWLIFERTPYPDFVVYSAIQMHNL